MHASCHVVPTTWLVADEQNHLPGAVEAHVSGADRPAEPLL
jgi:hypothetical protein